MFGIALMVVACAPKSDTPADTPAVTVSASLSADELVAVRAVSAEFARAMSAKDSAAVFALYADDALLLPPDSPALAISEGRGVLAGMMAAGASDFVLTPTTSSGIGDLAYQVGTASFTMGGATHTVKYLEVLRKGADGRWRYVADMFSGVTPPT